MVKKETARVNTNIIEISELKWMGTCEFNSEDHYIYHVGKNEVALLVNKSPKCSTWVQSQKWQNDLCFQGKPFNITVIQVYAQKTIVKEAEVERIYKDLQDLLELTSKK